MTASNQKDIYDMSNMGVVNKFLETGTSNKTNIYSNDLRENRNLNKYK